MKGWFRKEPRMGSPTDWVRVLDASLDIAHAIKALHDNDVMHGVRLSLLVATAFMLLLQPAAAAPADDDDIMMMLLH